jgi:hypothetical protein
MSCAESVDDGTLLNIGPNSFCVPPRPGMDLLCMVTLQEIYIDYLNSLMHLESSAICCLQVAISGNYNTQTGK